MQLIASKTRAERASAAAWHRAEPRGSAVLRALSLEWLGCKPRFNEASVLRWLFFVPVHMLPCWQEPPAERLCVHEEKLHGLCGAHRLPLKIPPFPQGRGEMTVVRARARSSFSGTRGSDCTCSRIAEEAG